MTYFVVTRHLLRREKQGKEEERELYPRVETDLTVHFYAVFVPGFRDWLMSFSLSVASII